MVPRDNVTELAVHYTGKKNQQQKPNQKKKATQIKSEVLISVVLFYLSRSKRTGLFLFL